MLLLTADENSTRNARLIQDFRDSSGRPIRRTIADGLAKLKQELGARPEAGCCHLHVPRQPGWTVQFAAIWYRPSEGNDIVIPYPFSRGCRARTTSGARIDLSLDELDGALLDDDGNVHLRDGRSVHALEFDTLPQPKDFTPLEHAIVFLTVRFLKAEAIGLRYNPEIGDWWIAYSRMPELSVRNVKELAQYIDAHIGTLSREDGQHPFSRVPLSKIQSTLARAGVRKVRGRRSNQAP